MFTRDELVDKALYALTQAALRARDEQIPITLELRFLFAFLALDHRRPFDMLWKEMTSAPSGNLALDHGRRQTIRSCTFFIHRMHGREPPEW